MPMILASFRAQITLVFGGLAVLMSTLFSVVVGSFVHDSIVADQARALSGVAAYAGGMLSGGLRERLHEIERLAATGAANPTPDQRTLERLVRSEPAYAWLAVTDADGTVRTESEPLLGGRSIAQQRRFAAARRGPYIGEVRSAERPADPPTDRSDAAAPSLLDLAVPIYGEGGVFAGVIVADLRWRWMVDLIESIRVQQLGEHDFSLFIVDQNGLPLYGPSGPVPKEAMTPLPRPLSPGLMGWPDGARYLTAAKMVLGPAVTGDLGWSVVARRSEASAVALARRARNAILVAGALIGMLAAALTWLLAATFSQPLRRISHAARRLEAGRFDEPMPRVGGSREIRGISRALNSMKRRLRVGHQAVQRAYRQVDARVRLRTEKLLADNAALTRLAERDALTGLHNRRAADDRLGAEVARHRRSGLPLSVLLIDIDHFKRINDEHGHASGDDALRQVASRLGEQLRSSDFVARFGGEEFLVLLPETPAALALTTAEKLRSAVAALDMAGIGRLTISIGVAEQPAGGLLKPAQLLHAADLALYEAKSAGRNRVVAFGALRTVPEGSAASP